jgi:DNA-binding transcriptional LysR family regulator
VPSGLVRLTASVGFAQVCIVPLLPDLCARHDMLGIDLLASDANLDLAAEGVDLAVRLAPRPHGDYVASMLRPTRYRVIASPAVAARYRPQNPGDLAAMPCVVFPLPGFRTRWKFRDRSGQIMEVDVHSRVQASSSIALRELARSDMGAALLGDWLVGDDLERGTLVDLFPSYDVTATEFETAIWLLYPSRRFLPAKTRAVIDFLRERLGGIDPTAPGKRSALGRRPSRPAWGTRDQNRRVR